MSPFQPTIYHAPFAHLWSIERLPALGPGTPNESVRAALAALTPDTAFPAVKNREAALSCISGTWLYHDFLDESHTICQDLPSWFGSYWHGIMHRREPDASNARYWFRRVGPNPVYERLAEEISELGLACARRTWDPFAFVDECEVERGSASDRETLCRRVQLREMQLLFDGCYREAASF